VARLAVFAKSFSVLWRGTGSGTLGPWALGVVVLYMGHGVIARWTLDVSMLHCAALLHSSIPVRSNNGHARRVSPSTIHSPT